MILAVRDMSMIGENESRQVLALSKDGASAEEIARSLDLELGMVKLVLGANGAGEVADRDINDEQLAQLREKAFNLAMYSQEDSVAARMTMFLIERDRPSKKLDSGVSIANINNALIAANSSFNDLLKEYKG